MSLWGDEFEVPSEKKEVKKVAKKVSSPKDPKVETRKAMKSKTVSTFDKLQLIYEEVNRVLGGYTSNTKVITSKDELSQYIDEAIRNGIIAIDTETNNSLEPLTCLLMGACIYTPGQLSAYIPVHHTQPDTDILIENQLTESDIKEQFERLSNTKILMHNGKFDYEVIKCTCNCVLNIYWDTEIAARILDENELAGLKKQYILHIDSTQEKYDIEHLFQGIPYAYVKPEIFALYAATDAYITYRLYEWQKDQFNKPGNEKLFDLFMNVEMPIVPVCAEMELYGIEIDKEYAKRLSNKYHKKVDEVNAKIDAELSKYSDKISAWRLTKEANYKERNSKPNKTGEFTYKKSKNEQLENPPQLNSPTQLAILLYDILGTPAQDKKSPRGTGEEILQKINLPICDLVLEKRGLEKLIGTYIDKIPECVNSKDNRLHAHFNQLGAGTGRFSSSNPNLQNIPSHVKEIRLMFRASDGDVFVGADFSQQEPRLLSAYSNDDTMIDAYKQNKDLYATIAAGVYKNDYWDNMEHRQDGTPNPEGKKRRSNCKSLLLGIMYGRGAPSIAEQIHSTVEEAQQIINDFYKQFPKVKEWTEKTEKDAKVTGYVEDLWGRRRRLPDILLPKYTVKSTKASTEFNPILYTLGKVNNSSAALVESYKKKLSKVKSRNDYQKIQQEAERDGIYIVDNGAFISQAERQCVNARIQGGAASMTKVCMRKVFDDEELNRLGAKLVLQIHDEVIVECPKQNAEAVMSRLTYVMKTSVADKVQVPFKCDGYIVNCWYEDDFGDILKQELQKLIESGTSKEESFSKLLKEHSELTSEQLTQLLS
jgi:DNA polymerase-1|uniref:DNA polymerase n=1 Tax=Siphoviridae sp. ctsf32 TaxID=2827594 RepID=A0A8S5LN73_9CAUD|nr:MAG TPA: DNA polymerase [Siphoviridae sp. ctsf32]